jgi:hypothetical protein
MILRVNTIVDATKYPLIRIEPYTQDDGALDSLGSGERNCNLPVSVADLQSRINMVNSARGRSCEKRLRYWSGAASPKRALPLMNKLD